MLFQEFSLCPCGWIVEIVADVVEACVPEDLEHAIESDSASDACSDDTIHDDHELAPAVVETTPANILHTLRDVNKVDDIIGALPEFSMRSWEILKNGKRCGIIRMVGGFKSLRCDCQHTVGGNKCKLHLDINGKYNECQAWLVRWCIHGCAVNKAAHEIAGEAEHERWKVFSKA